MEALTSQDLSSDPSVTTALGEIKPGWWGCETSQEAPKPAWSAGMFGED